MCGRFVIQITGEALGEIFDARVIADLLPSWNVAPTNLAPIVLVRPDGSRVIEAARFGLVPPWAARDPGSAGSLFNARSETVHEKPAFRTAFAHARCLVPADGFYEWEKIGREKQPWYFHDLGGDLLCFAGIWARVRLPDESELLSFSILTTAANADVAPIHDRMAVTLAPSDRGAWLDPTTRDPRHLLPPERPTTTRLARHRVSRAVGSPRANGPELIEPAASGFLFD